MSDLVVDSRSDARRRDPYEARELAASRSMSAWLVISVTQTSSRCSPTGDAGLDALRAERIDDALPR